MAVDLLHENYHTHTALCRHATGTVAEYCAAAIEAGAVALGFTDHTPLPDGRWQGVRMAMDQLDGYCREIDCARQQFPRLPLFKGLECEYAEEYVAFFREELLGTYAVDYLIGATHWCPYRGDWIGVHGELDSPSRLRAYARHVVATMESGLFTFIAHPDLFWCSYPVWDAEAVACSREILAASAALHVPLEINGYGLRKPCRETVDGPRPRYPVDAFWELAAEYEAPVVIASDAHRPRDVLASLDDCLAIARRCGLTVIRPERFRLT